MALWCLKYSNIRYIVDASWINVFKWIWIIKWHGIDVSPFQKRLFVPLQSGFRPGVGIEIGLVTPTNCLLQSKSRGSAALLILLDLLMAFYTIRRGILLDWLLGVEIEGPLLQGFCSYLGDSFQQGTLGNFCSAPLWLNGGVLQRSILYPMLFMTIWNHWEKSLKVLGLDTTSISAPLLVNSHLRLHICWIAVWRL